MRVLGLDPGTSRFGWGIVSAQDGELTSKSGVVVQPASLSKSRRLYAIWKALERLDAYGPIDVVVIEKGFGGPRAHISGVLAVGEARGVAYLVAGHVSAPIVEIHPAQMKKAVTGSGSGSKELVRATVNATLDLQPPYTIVSEDEADAVGLALAVMHDRDVPEVLARG